MIKKYVEEVIVDLIKDLGWEDTVKYKYSTDPVKLLIDTSNAGEVDLTKYLPANPSMENNINFQNISWNEYFTNTGSGGPLATLVQYGKGKRLKIQVEKI